MSTTQTSADPTFHRFRAATIDAALADARAELGDVEIVEANRIRRGGVGGFFATDLGVELVVRTPAAEAAAGDDEYVDSTDVGGLARLPRASARDDRPPFYDRVRDERPVPTAARPPAPTGTTDSITAELERLLGAADGGGAGTRSFAAHLAEQLAQPAADRPPTPAHAVASTPEPTPDTTPDTTTPATPEPTPDTTPAATTPATPEPTPDTTPTATTPPAATPATPPRRTPAASRDPWRKSIDLAAGAVGRLVEQLSDVTPATGSRMQSLSRLTVSVTTPDGAVIELTAELEGDH